MPPVAPDELSDPNDVFDYGADADPDAKEAGVLFAELDRLTLEAERTTASRKRAEDELAKIKKVEDRLLGKVIPELLGRMRQSKCTTSSGIDVSIKRDIKASLPGHERVEDRLGALRWLVDHGHGGVIKNVVTVPLDRGEDDRANALLVELQGKGFAAEQKKDVHAGQLSALVRELMATGTTVPRDIFNIFDHNIVKLARKP